MIESIRHVVALAGIAGVLVTGACSPTAGSDPDAAPQPPAATGACSPESLTQACSCGLQSGRQTCLQGQWSACECASATLGGVPTSTGDAGGGSAPLSFPGNDRSDITFSWNGVAPPGNDGSCPPGTYEGNLEGVYYSILNPTPIGLPIANFDLPGQPSGFHFELAPAAGGETIQKVKGEVNGLADALFPFKAQVDGELNCRTATFTGTLHDGSYAILVDGLLPQKFEGVASAKYDKRTHTFINGSWDVAETTATPPGKLAPTLPRDLARDGYGGSGDFAGALPTDPSDPNLTPCPGGLTCGQGPLGPNKALCINALGAPTCTTDADCNLSFPGENIPCLKASLFSICIRECKK